MGFINANFFQEENEPRNFGYFSSSLIKDYTLYLFPKAILIILQAIYSSIPHIVNAMESSPKEGTYVEGEILIAYKDSETSLGTLSKSMGLPIRSIKKLERFNCEHVALPKGLSVQEAISKLSKFQGIRYCEPNYLYELHKTPDDPEFDRLWALEKIGAPIVWEHTTGSVNVVVGVLDSGIHYNHPDIASNVWRNPGEIPDNGMDDDDNGYVDDIMGIDLVDDDSDPLDDSGHGSHVSGILGAVGNNNSAVTGINWQVKILALRISSADGFINSARIAKALDYILDMKSRGINIRITNNSWGGSNPSQILHDVFSQLSNAGVLIVCAAGNSRKNNDFSPSFPANYDVGGIISVAASREEDRIAGFSNYGRQTVDLAAPGTTILSLHKDRESLAYQQGTSMAAPHVTGAAALLSSFDPSLSMATLKSIIMGSVDRIPEMENFVASGGRLSVANAMEFLRSDSRVDLVFGRSTSDVFSGQDMYLSSVDQKVTGVASVDNPTVYYLKIENDGGHQDSFTVKSDLESNEEWSITFYDAWDNGNDVTDQIINDGWNVIDLPTEEFKPFRVEVAPVVENSAQDALSFTISSQVLSNENVFDKVWINTRSKSVQPGIHLASKSGSGKSGNGSSFNSGISGNGRFVVFASDATNLVSDDTNEERDIFVRDLVLGNTEIIHFTDDDQTGVNLRDMPSISANGQYVVFETSFKENNDTITPSNVYLKDRQTGDLRRISKSFLLGGLPNAPSYQPQVSSDGRYVVYTSFANNIDVLDSGFNQDIFLYDIQNDTTEIVSVSSLNIRGNGTSVSASINDDGSIVAFISDSTNLVNSDTNGIAQVYLRDRVNGTTHLVSVSNSGLVSNKDCSKPHISGDGRIVLYESLGTNLIPGQDNEFKKVFLYEVQNGFTELVSFTDSGNQANKDSLLPAISSNGRFITFTSAASNIIDSEKTPAFEIYLWDRLTGNRDIIGYNEKGIKALNNTNGGTFSADGQFLAFNSWVASLSFEDGNGSSDVFVVNLGRVRPNAMISKWDEEDFSGVGIVNTKRSQRQSQEIMPGETAAYKIRVLNQGVESDQLKIDSTSAPTGWNVRFLNLTSDSGDITEEIVAHGWTTPSLQPGESIELKLEVTIDGNPNNIPRSFEMVVTMSAANKRGAMDAVSAVTSIPQSFPGSFMISRSMDGTPANSTSSRMSLSADGRFVTFMSEASNLVPEDSNERSDVFLYNRVTDRISRVSESLSGGGGLAESTSPSISRDRSRLVFHSRSSNTIDDTTEIRNDIYLRDYANDTLKKVTVVPESSGVVEANRGSQLPRLSGNGKWIIFQSVATNLGPEDDNGAWDLYLYDIDNQLFEIISQSSTGELGNGDSTNGHITFDGRYIVFNSFATNLVLDDENVYEDVYLIDREENHIELISKSFDGATANGPSIANGISDDGRFILFSSYASNIAQDDMNGELDLFLYDHSTDETVPINTESQIATGAVGSGSGSISPDGEWITFSTIANALNSEYSSEFSNVVVYHIETGEISVISLTNLDKQANGSSFSGEFSADGRYMAFLTRSSDLAGELPRDTGQVMLYDMASFQPDILVAGGENSVFRGENLFEPEEQKVYQLTSAGDTKVFKTRVKNGGTYPDRFVITGNTLEDNSYEIGYFFGEIDISELVMHEGWVTSELVPGEMVEIEIRIKENSTISVDRNVLLDVLSTTDVFKADQAIAITEADHDKDGMSDTWEKSFWGTITQAAMNTDQDDDNILDFQEFIAGTDPTTTDSKPILSIDKTPGKETFTLRWQSNFDRFYTLQQAGTADGIFTDLTEQIRGAPPENTYEDLNSESKNTSFYRLHIERP